MTFHSDRKWVSPDAEIGEGTIIQAGAVIEEDCRIGRGCRIGYHAVLRQGTVIGDYSVFGSLSASEGWNRIGDNVTIHSQCHITEDAVIEDFVFIAPLFCGANTLRIVHGRDFPLVKEGYTIKRGARIAIQVAVLPGVTVGRDALIGAGAGVDVRFPFLDPELIAISRGLPRAAKVEGRETKILLRRALRGDLPEEIVEAGRIAGTKGGFTPSIAGWWRMGLGDWVDEQLRSVPRDLKVACLGPARYAKMRLGLPVNHWILLRLATAPIFQQQHEEGAYEEDPTSKPLFASLISSKGEQVASLFSRG